MKVNQAKQAIKEGNFEKAISLLSEVIIHKSEHFENFALRAVAYRKNKNFELAIVDFNKAIELEPSNADLRTEKGVCLFHQKETKLALLEMDIAVKLEPGNPYRYSSRAFIKDALKDVDGAIADYKKAIELDPEDAIAENNLGMLEEKKGNIEKAKKHFKQSDDLQGIDMKKITEDAVKDGGTSILKTDAKKEVIKLQEQEASQQDLKGNKHKSSTWKIMIQVFSDRDTFKEFIAYLKALLSKRK
ncbi:MAG: Flp pilus assembly protein TadD [Saprospiraceae bacterium]|jgi:Flp pilus assembly protein TadD